MFRLPSESSSSAPLELSLVQEGFGKGSILSIFPEGRYLDIPSEELRSLNHHFVLAVYPLFGENDQIIPPGQAVERECSPFYLIRES